MILTDLVAFNSQNELYDTCKTKMHGTLVRYRKPDVVGDYKWYYCEINISDDDGELNQDEYLFGAEYGSEYSCKWIHLARRNEKTISLRTLAGIDTEPTWPAAGSYWVEGNKYTISYKQSASYKAGLSSKSVLVTDHSGRAVGTMYLPRIFDAAASATYPSLNDAVGLLGNGVYSVPVSKTLTVAPHPYVNGPVLHWETFPVGLIKNGRVLLTESSKDLEEYLQHMGIDYANAV